MQTTLAEVDVGPGECDGLTDPQAPVCASNSKNSCHSSGNSDSSARRSSSASAFARSSGSASARGAMRTPAAGLERMIPSSNAAASSTRIARHQNGSTTERAPNWGEAGDSLARFGPSLSLSVTRTRLVEPSVVCDVDPASPTEEYGWCR